MAIATVEDRLERLSTASARRVLEPDEVVTGDFGPGQIVPDELLLTAGLDLDLDAETKRRLAIEQTAALLEGGIRLEATLIGGFGLLLADRDRYDDPRVVYLLHELGEETRHSRLFIRMLEQLGASARNPYRRGLSGWISRRVFKLAVSSPALLCTMVLAGEEIPDLIQRRQVEHPDTDDYLRRANAYHRQEEARHMAFARMLLPEVWSDAGPWSRFLVKRVAPLMVGLMLDTQLFHPGIYDAVGLPGHRTWRAVHRSEPYRAMVYEATRPLLAAVTAAAPELAERVPRGWRRLCGVDRRGKPVE
jgi:hypothetical protein